jgi:tRNA pseudouridine55 synthase
MDRILLINKPIGYTPLQVVTALKKGSMKYQDQTISYAGRLDPMAEGLLVLLVGEENKKRKEYEGMEKEYEFEVLLGVGTDSYDLLGVVTDTSSSFDDTETSVLSVVPQLVGKHIQPFPPYSAKPVHGIPLYKWARENRLHEIVIPEKEIEVRSLRHLGTHVLSQKKLQESIFEKLTLVRGDFRQDAIYASWERFFASTQQKEFVTMTFKATVTSGTYIRSLAKRMGEMIGIASLAFSIKRTRVGDFVLSDAVDLADKP